MNEFNLIVLAVFFLFWEEVFFPIILLSTVVPANFKKFKLLFKFINEDKDLRRTRIPSKYRVGE